MTIREALTKGMIILKNNNVETPKLKARLLLQYILKKPRQYLIVYDNKEIDKKEQWEYFVNIEKLTNGVPLQHITHRQEFMKMDFFVDENVLIPRPDTEILVEEVIKIAQKYNSPRILDLCTGSGAIAISLKKFVPSADITAVDISEKALEIAQKNAEKLEAKINFVKSNLFDKLDNKKFDIIVSNPPYIRKDEIIKEGSKVFGEFKDFIARGNVIDLAVGVVIGSAFGKIVTSIVNDILMPIIGIIIGGIDFSGLSLKIGSATVNYGMFIQNVIDFLIVAICIFFFIKVIEKVTKKKEENEEKVEEAKKDEQIILLEEIRDLLKESKDK
mgnify:CR=1 FL=1